MKKCKLCEKGKIEFTAWGSCNKADVFMQNNNILTLYGDNGAAYHLECNFCPKCGKKLTQNPINVTRKL